MSKPRESKSLHSQECFNGAAMQENCLQTEKVIYAPKDKGGGGEDADNNTNDTLTNTNNRPRPAVLLPSGGKYSQQQEPAIY